MIENPSAYRRILMEQAYADEHSLLVRRRTHELYTEPRVDMQDWVLSRFEWAGGEYVLDIGSGPGTYLESLFARIDPDNYIAGDLSIGMLRALHRKHVEVAAVALDGEYLPFPDETFDGVLANHVLHHIPVLEHAIAEIQRVLRQPDGVLIAATSSEYTMPEFTTLIQRAIRLLRRTPGEDLDNLTGSHRFSLEHGAIILARSFQSVARYDIPGVLVFEEAQPVMEYLESCRPFYEMRLPAGVQWDAFMEIMDDQVRRLVNHFGKLEVNKLAGVLVATHEGGFARDYQKLLLGR